MKAGVKHFSAIAMVACVVGMGATEACAQDLLARVRDALSISSLRENLSPAGIRSNLGNMRDATLGADDSSMTKMGRRYRDYRDARVNRDGDHPEWERKDALKRIADPDNLAPEKPEVIKAAAKIKTDQDLKEQKLKAIKYLATVCCNCDGYAEDVKEGLFAALSDCDADVRYEAAVAFCKCAGDPCHTCTSSCCDPDIMAKLDEMANKHDDKGCPLEPSPRVRAAARLALDRCRMVRPEEPEPKPAPKLTAVPLTSDEPRY